MTLDFQLNETSVTTAQIFKVWLHPHIPACTNQLWLVLEIAIGSAVKMLSTPENECSFYFHQTVALVTISKVFFLMHEI